MPFVLGDTLTTGDQNGWTGGVVAPLDTGRFMLQAVDASGNAVARVYEIDDAGATTLKASHTLALDIWDGYEIGCWVQVGTNRVVTLDFADDNVASASPYIVGLEYDPGTETISETAGTYNRSFSATSVSAGSMWSSRYDAPTGNGVIARGCRLNSSDYLYTGAVRWLDSDPTPIVVYENVESGWTAVNDVPGLELIDGRFWMFLSDTTDGYSKHLGSVDSNGNDFRVERPVTGPSTWWSGGFRGETIYVVDNPGMVWTGPASTGVLSPDRTAGVNPNDVNDVIPTLSGMYYASEDYGTPKGLDVVEHETDSVVLALDNDVYGSWPNFGMWSHSMQHDPVMTASKRWYSLAYDQYGYENESESNGYVVLFGEDRPLPPAPVIGVGARTSRFVFGRPARA